MLSYRHALTNSVLPPVISEEAVCPFKFWFNQTVQHGMYFHNELFYCLETVALNQQAQLYLRACQLGRHAHVVVTVTQTDCSLWVSLRNPELLLDKEVPSASHDGIE